ncbi:hypothetical protein FRC12_004331 [Ceratobasidium sp. 428]|nr:hypothetical protein FRC12_004331 [Ceratobasidium sp. 428]
MPAQRRQRKTAQGSSVPSQPKSVGLSSDPATLSNRGTPPGELSFIPDPETSPDAPAEHETAAVTDSQLDENPPADHDTPGVADASDQDDSTVIEGTPDPEGAPQPEEDETNIDCEKYPIDPPENPMRVFSPRKARVIKDKSRPNARAPVAPGNPPAQLEKPMASTGIRVLDDALEDLRLSRSCLWLGNYHLIFRNCRWVEGDRPSMSTLQWKPDAPNKVADGEGDAVIGFLGMVSNDSGVPTGTDGGWVEGYGEPKLPKHKRVFRSVRPGSSSKIEKVLWDCQLQSALRIVENGCKGSKNHKVTHCFANKVADYLRVRSPLFLPNTVPQEDDEDDADPVPPAEEEDDIPKDFKYPTWNFNTDDIQAAFDRVVQRGFEPQVLPAFTRFNKLIHPNKVAVTLPGAIVLVYCTLERSEFNNKEKGGKTEFGFYANLVKVQVLKAAPPLRPISAIKRKFLPIYGAHDAFQAPPKRVRLAYSED